VDFGIHGTAEVAEFYAECGQFCARMQSEQVACWNITLVPSPINFGTRKIQTLSLGYGSMSGTKDTGVAAAFSDGYTTVGLNFAPRVVVSGSMTFSGTAIFILDNGDLYSYGHDFAKGVAKTTGNKVDTLSRIVLGEDSTTRVISASCGGQHCCAIDGVGQVSSHQHDVATVKSLFKYCDYKS
jgi:hypothetical protein